MRGGGLLVLHEGSTDEVTIDWWVGADDRWYRPDTEITTRQHLVRNAPIVQTSVRIPSGDALLTLFGAVQGQRELVVGDVENRSKVPFAVALVLRGPGVRNVSVSGPVVRVDGFPLLTLPRPPQRLAGVGRGGDLASVVMSGAAGTALPAIAGASEVALILPVTHGTTLRYAALLGASSGIALHGTPVLASLPEVHRAAAGWGIHLGRLPQVSLPDSERAATMGAIGAALLLAAEPAIADRDLSVPRRAALATALALSGCSAESGALLDGIGGFQLGNGSFDAQGAHDVLTSAHVIRAMATYASLSGDALFARSFAPTMAGAIEFALKRSAKGKDRRALAVLVDAARFFTVANDSAAVSQCRKAWAKAGSPWPLPELPLPPLPAVGPGGSLVPDDPIRLASAVVSAIRTIAVLDADDVVDIVPGFRPEWRGAKLDVRNVATPGGRLSFSLRWHGARPALLWDVEDPTGVEMRVRCSSIDPGWGGSGPKGEALLNVGR